MVEENFEALQDLIRLYEGEYNSSIDWGKAFYDVGKKIYEEEKERREMIEEYGEDEFGWLS